MFQLNKQAKDLTGKKFGKLTVLYPFKDPASGQLMWMCRCECGAEIARSSRTLNNGLTTSCGSKECKRECIRLKASKIHPGDRFGRLTVLEVDYSSPSGRIRWICRCDCGKVKSISADQLLRGETVSCGCYMRENNTKWHSADERRIANILHNMKQRCYNPNDSNYQRWGARGITICEEWMRDTRAFVEWAMANGYREGLSIDRIDNNGPYAPWNCRWADWFEQANNRSSSRLITVGDITMSVEEWSRQLEVNRMKLYERTNEELVKLIPEIAIQNGATIVTR